MYIIALWNIQKDVKTQLSPTRLGILPQAGSLPTDVKFNYGNPSAAIGEPLLEHADFPYLIPRPPRVSQMTEKGLAHWMEKREQRCKNQSYYSEIIDNHIIRIQSLLVSMENLDIVKDFFNKVLYSY